MAKSTSKSKSKPAAKAPASKKPAAPAVKPAAKPAAKPTPTQKPKKPATDGYTVAEIVAASEAIDYALVVRAASGPTTYNADTTEIVVGPPTLFALEPTNPTARRFLHLIQKDATSGQVVLMHVVDGAGVTRVPAANGWQRAMVEGTLHLLASDLLLSRKDIVELIGGHEPPTGTVKPPFI